MKKTFSANISGHIYNIDEDAYNLLQDYLNQLHATFRGIEGDEIVADIEGRVSELLDERPDGAKVVTLTDVNSVIETMGRPEQLGEPAGATPPPFHGVEGPQERPQKKLYRDVRNEVFGGVLSGVAQYFGWNVTILRIFAVVAALCTYFWPCVLAYLIAWMVIPPARTAAQILQMQGEPVNISTVGATVMDRASSAVNSVDTGGFANMVKTALSILGKFVLGFFAFGCGITAVVCGILALVIIAGMCCYYFQAAPGLLESFDISLVAPYLSGWAMTLLMICVALPCAAILWAGCMVFFKAPAMSKPAIIMGVVIEIMFIVACVVLFTLAGNFN